MKLDLAHERKLKNPKSGGYVTKKKGWCTFPVCDSLSITYMLEGTYAA